LLVILRPWWYVCCVLCTHSAQHTEHTHHRGLDITCCHTTAYSITTYF